jgi:hypothetical protein
MLLILGVLVSFSAFFLTIKGFFKIIKGIAQNDSEMSKKWLRIVIFVTIFSTLFSWFISLVRGRRESDSIFIDDKFYILNEDYNFYDQLGQIKCSFKKGEVVRGIVVKMNANNGQQILTAAQSQSIKVDYLSLLNAKISIPIQKLRYPSDTEIKEINGDIQKILDNLQK